VLGNPVNRENFRVAFRSFRQLIRTETRARARVCVVRFNVERKPIRVVAERSKRATEERVMKIRREVGVFLLFRSIVSDV